MTDSDTLNEEPIGSFRTQDGKEQKIEALFSVFRDEREVTLLSTEAGTIVVSTKSWLRENDRKLVQTVNHYTLDTFAMMLETMLLGAEYMGLDIKKQMELLHAGGAINYEYAGRGEPKFSAEAESRSGDTEATT